MKKILTALIFMISMNTIAQNTHFDISKDPKGDGLIFKGLITFEDLNKEPTFTWLKSGSDDYAPKEGWVTYLQNNLKRFSMVVFLGTWCDDSHYLIPKLEKVLRTIDYPKSLLTMYGVDREKKTKNGEEKKYGITLVPTIIVFDIDGKEVGRVTESVNKSIEEDIASFLSNRH